MSRGEVDDAARQRHRAQPGKAPRIRLGVGEVEEADARRLQQHLDEERLGRGGEDDGVDAAFQQADHRRRLRLANERDRRRVDPVRLDQPSNEVGNAAARLADVDAPAGELREARQLGRLEQPLRPSRRGRRARPARRTGCRARPGRRRRRRCRRSPPADPRRRLPARRRCRPRHRAGAGGRCSRPRRRSSSGAPRRGSPSGSARSACRTRRRHPGPGRSRERPGAAASGRAASRRWRAGRRRGG